MELIILVGNIGSGKSTVARTLVEKGYICVSLDAIRYGIGAGKYIFNPALEPIVFKSGWYILNEFMEWGYQIVADETNMSVKYRKKFIDLAKKMGYRIKAIVMPRLSMDESVSRRLKSNHGTANKATWETVWKKFDSRYQEPSYAEGFDLIEFYEGGTYNG